MRIKQYLKCLAVFPLVLFVMCSAANAQSIVTGAVSGTAIDASGAAVSDANVTLTNDETQEKTKRGHGTGGIVPAPAAEAGTV
jgi:hypothetical protein